MSEHDDVMATLQALFVRLDLMDKRVDKVLAAQCPSIPESVKAEMRRNAATAQDLPIDGFPQPKRTFADWESAPEWAKWHAIDSDGLGVFYAESTEPYTGGTWWYRGTQKYCHSTTFTDFGDWRETLEEKPAKPDMREWWLVHNSYGDLIATKKTRAGAYALICKRREYNYTIVHVREVSDVR